MKFSRKTHSSINTGKILAISCLIILLSLPMSTKAEENNTGAVLNDTYTSQKTQKELEKLAIEKDIKIKTLLEDSVTPMSAYGEFYTINVTAYKQETTYWCGPASAKQALSFHKSYSGSSASVPSQSTLASKSGTTTSGSSTTGIASSLNAYASTFSFSSSLYVAADITNVSSPLQTFESRIKGDLKYKQNAPVILLQTAYLPRYKGVSCRHYNTVSGYSYEFESGDKQVETVDPHYNPLYFGTYWNPLGSTTSNGVFRAVYQADLAGSNKAMAY